MSYKHFKCGYLHFTLKEGPKVICDSSEDFPYVVFTFQTSSTNNKWVISTFKFGYPRLTLKGGPRSNVISSEDS